MKNGLQIIYKAALLLQYRCIGPRYITQRVDNNSFNHFDSQVVIVIKIYSTSTKDRATIYCFLIFQEIGELLKKRK